MSLRKNPLEEHLVCLWRDVLNIESVGTHDSFFDMGGHSLKVLMLLGRIRQEFGVELSVRSMFDAPTVAGQAVLIGRKDSTAIRQSLTPVQPIPTWTGGQRREIPAQESVKRASEGKAITSGSKHLKPPITPLPRAPHHSRLPLTFGEQRMLFLDRHDNSRSAYNVLLAWRLYGPLDESILHRAFSAIVQRHEILRTGFRIEDDSPQRVILRNVPINIDTVDLRELGSDKRNKVWRDGLLVWANQHVDLIQPPLVRVKLWRLGDQDRVFAVLLHHIVCDEWSLSQMFQELTALYEAGGEVDQVRLAEPAVQMVDVAGWQKQAHKQGLWSEQLAFWRDCLANFPNALELPVDRPRPVVQAYEGASVDFGLPAEITDALGGLACQEKMTLFMTILAAFKVLLFRYTNQEDIIVGSPIANREQPEVRNTLGFFLNTLPFRTDLSGNPTFRQLLRRVRDTALNAYAHAEIPFEKLVNELKANQDPSRHPFFQTAFVLIDEKQAAFTPSGMTSELISIPSKTAKFDLTLLLQRTPLGLQGFMEYSTNLFNKPTIQRMANHLQILLTGIVSNPDQRLGQLPLLRQEEKHQLLHTWNNTAADYPRNSCIHELFEQQATRTPDAIAIVFEDQRLTYRELNQQANRLGHHLRELGVGPEVPVGLCLERSPELIVGILGILKAGGAYVPLDPDHPSKRLEYLLNDSRSSLVVTNRQVAERLGQASQYRVYLDINATGIETSPTENLAHETSPHSLAYVMYTSGSTGRPKGVEIQHRSIARLVFGNPYARFGADRVFLQLAPASFDASTFEIWGALLHGAVLVLPTQQLPSPVQIERLIKNHKVTTLWLTTALFNLIVENHPETVETVEEILTGGESLSVRHIRMAQRKLGPNVQLVNGYGPTESTTFTTCHRINRELPDDLSSIPIGRPISNTQVFVLDGQQQPVPVGVYGEVYIGGDGLARGYLNQPELTAEKFIANPFRAEQSSRLYRTGDIGRWLVDGTLEFQGRRDHQVKLRGFRIELGEIESILTEHSQVSQAVVHLREDRPGDKRLVGYYVALNGVSLTQSELVRHLRKKLPAYMVPSAFVGLSTLPLTPNGKVDRNSLPPPEDARPVLETHRASPDTEILQSLASIWSEVLKVERVGMHDNFFKLGGDSLKVLSLLSKIEKRLGIPVTVSTFLEGPTPSQFVANLEKPPPTDTFSVVELRKGTGQAPVIFLPDRFYEVNYSLRMIQFFDQDRPILGVRACDQPNSPASFNSIETLTDDLIKVILKAHPNSGFCLLGYSFAGLVAYETARRLQRMGKPPGFVGIIDTGPKTHPMGIRERVQYLFLSLLNFPRWLHGVGIFRFRSNTARCLHNYLPKLARVIEPAWQGLPQGWDGKVKKSLPSPSVLARKYDPQPFDGKLNLFRAKVKSLAHSHQQDLGWAPLVRELEISSVPGAHDSLLSPSNIPVLVERIQAAMKKAESNQVTSTRHRA